MADAASPAVPQKKKKKPKQRTNQSTVDFCIVDAAGAVVEKVRKKKKSKEDKDDDAAKKARKKERKRKKAEAAAAAGDPAPDAGDAIKKKKRKKDDAPAPAPAPAAPTRENPLGATRLFVGNLPWSVTDEGLAEALGCPLPVIKRITDRESGKFYGSCFVEAPDAAAAAAAVAKNGADLGGRPMKVAYAPPRAGDVWPPVERDSTKRSAATVVREKTARPDGGTTKLFVGNVAYEATDSDVHKLFADVAPLRGMRWVTHKHSGDFKGCGYLMFLDADGADAAMEKLDGATLCGRKIRLDYTE